MSRSTGTSGTTSMMARSQTSRTTPLRVAFIGAGAINFGDREDKCPWDHATRLEGLASSRPLMVVGIADPCVSRAEAALQARATQPDRAAAALYSECRVFSNYLDMLREARPEAVWIGVPPSVHGALTDGKDMELQALQHGCAVFVEKPVSSLPPELVVPYCAEVMRVSAAKELPVSVGYMFRYSKAVQKMKELVDTVARGRVMSFNARYNAAYAAIPHRFWWMTSCSGGPIVEQATHFVDIARYICGEVDAATLTGMAIGADDPSGFGQLAAVPAAVKEETIATHDRIPRVTSAMWRFKNGGIGSLTHALLLQGKEYENAITVWADGLSLELQRPYSDTPTLLVKVGNSDDVTTLTFGDDDMYLTEDAAFVDAILNRARGSDVDKSAACGGSAGSTAAQFHTEAFPGVRSSYEDGVKTYLLTCQIRDSAKP